MMMSSKRASRATPIRRVRATCRVPFGLMPVMAATAVMSTASPSHAGQPMTNYSIPVGSTLRTHVGESCSPDRFAPVSPSTSRR